MSVEHEQLPHTVHQVDLCVIGGGMAGLCTALSAARHGATVALMHDRPVLGGNASSEIRMHICGADRSNDLPNLRETGIIEELRLENVHRNPNKNFSIWDLILYEKLRFEPNMTLLLNCSCLAAETSGPHIDSVTGWQMTTQTYHEVQAQIYADCSGDAILAPLTGAEFRMGHESRAEYGESLAPEQANSHTMGMTCLFQTRKYDIPQPFTPPPWAYRYDSCEELPYGVQGHQWWQMGYWWVELGGDQHSIFDTETIRDELLRIALGVWDHIKNRCSRCRHDAENWALEWLQFLPGKRESRRYVGDHVLTQLDVEAEGKFEDVVAYGGWTMDDHDPAGFKAVELGHPATIFHPTPSPYGIPYRSLYSRNVENLMFAGRCASCTHMAMSSTRVMGTACSMGQAAGTAAALATRRGLMPKDVNEHVRELQQSLLVDDCYLPGVVQEFGPLTMQAELAASQGDPEPLRDGVDRPVGDEPHSWRCCPGDAVAYRFDSPQHVAKVTLVVDSALDRPIAMSYHGDYGQLTTTPQVVPKSFRIEGLLDGEWTILQPVQDNYQRRIEIPLGASVEGIRFVLEATWGSPETSLYAFYLS